MKEKMTIFKFAVISILAVVFVIVLQVSVFKEPKPTLIEIIILIAIWRNFYKMED